MAYRNKTYVAFDADNDIRFYRLMQAWKENGRVAFSFHDAHDLTNIMQWSSEETIKRRLRERLKNSKVFILLVGERTKYHYKFVRWEIQQAMKLNIPIVVVNLNGKRYYDKDRCPAILSEELALHVSFNQKIVDKALNEWPDLSSGYQRENKNGPYRYNKETYTSAGL